MNDEYMMDEEYVEGQEFDEHEETFKNFAQKLNYSLFEDLVDAFLEEPVMLYDDDGQADICTALFSDFCQRAFQGEFGDPEDYLSALCVHIGDQELRDTLIDEFELYREYIEEELADME